MNHKISIKITHKPAMKEYPIFIGTDIYDINAWLPKKIISKIVIITHHTVKKRYGLHLQKILNRAGHHCLLFSFPAGEKFKNNKTKETIENAMMIHHCDRDTFIVALGGGIVGDLAGLIAATYLRGISYIQIPTTLLAMIDSSVGGKTGINTPHGKNLIGAIYHPICVVADVTLLKSLSKKNRINGLIEAIKMFLTHDAKSFHYTASHLQSIIEGDETLLKEIIFRAVKIKAGVVSRDEKEHGERSLLNFGHTIGHALEKISHYTLPHGYAVAYGILIETAISHALGLLDIHSLLTIKNLMSQLGVRGKDLKKYELTQLIQATKNDKKRRFKKTHYILLKKIGKAHMINNQYIHPVTDKIIKKAFKNTIEE